MHGEQTSTMQSVCCTCHRGTRTPDRRTDTPLHSMHRVTQRSWARNVCEHNQHVRQSISH